MPSEGRLNDETIDIYQYVNKPFEQWPRQMQAIQLVICLNDHELGLEEKFILSEIDRLGLMSMTKAEIMRFRAQHLLDHN